MSHLSDRQLVEIYYGDGAVGRMQGHVVSCTECAARYASLRAALDAVEAPPPAEPESGFEQRLWLQLAPRLDRTGGRALFRHFRRPRWMGAFNWRMAAAMAAMLLAGFFAGRYRPQPKAQEAGRADEASRQRVRLAALSDHLERSEFVLLELVNAEGKPDVNIRLEQQWAGELLDDNRLLREAAQSDGDLAAATLLDDLERIFLDVVHEPSTLDALQMDALRQRVESGETLFRVRLLGRQLRTPEGFDLLSAPSGRS